MAISIRTLRHRDEPAGEPLQYKLCGLNDVYLLNGYKWVATEDGRALSVKDADDLHRAIAARIVSEKRFLNGKAVRFLRKAMDLTQAELALLLGSSAQTVARWEKGTSEVPGRPIS